MMPHSRLLVSPLYFGSTAQPDSGQGIVTQLLTFFVAGLFSLTDIFQHLVGIEIVFFVVFDVTGIFELEEDKPFEVFRTDHPVIMLRKVAKDLHDFGSFAPIQKVVACGNGDGGMIGDFPFTFSLPVKPGEWIEPGFSRVDRGIGVLTPGCGKSQRGEQQGMEVRKTIEVKFC